MASLAKNWWLVVLLGVLTAFLWPGLTLLVLIILFGIYALADGLVGVITGLTHVKDSPRWWVFLLEAR